MRILNTIYGNQCNELDQLIKTSKLYQTVGTQKMSIISATSLVSFYEVIKLLFLLFVANLNKYPINIRVLLQQLDGSFNKFAVNK